MMFALLSPKIPHLTTVHLILQASILTRKVNEDSNAPTPDSTHSETLGGRVDLDPTPQDSTVNILTTPLDDPRDIGDTDPPPP